MLKTSLNKMGQKRKIKMLIHPDWVWLIKKCETEFPFSRVVLLLQNGVPQAIEKGIARYDPRDKHYGQGKTRVQPEQNNNQFAG